VVVNGEADLVRADLVLVGGGRQRGSGPGAGDP